jgi:hypothetical protein
MNISHYIPRGSNLAEEHKVLDLTNTHKLCTSVFKLMNIVSVMNMDPKNIKKSRNECLFPLMIVVGTIVNYLKCSFFPSESRVCLYTVSL